MAKNKAGNGEFKFDVDLDFTLDDVDVFGEKKTKKDRNPVFDVMRGAGSAAKSKLKSGSFWDSVARKALPKDYGYLSDELGKAKDSLSELYRDSARTLRPELSKIGKQINLLVPEESKRLKNLTKKMAGDGPGYSAPSQEAMQSQAIGQGLSDVFDRANEQNNQREVRNNVEARIKDKIDTKRFSANINILGGIHEGISRIVGYTTTINAAFQKKSLELQYRSYFTQAELLRASDAHYKKAEAYYEAIKHNTGLPDFVKITATERFKEIGMNKLFSGIQSGLGAAMGRVKKKVGGMVSEVAGHLGAMGSGLGGIQMLKESQQMMKEMGMGESAYHQGGGLIGEMLMSGALGKWGAKLGKLFPRDGKVAQTIFKIAKYTRDPGALVKNIRGRKGFQNARDGGGALGGITKGLDYFLNEFITPEHDTKVTSGRQMGMHQDAFFDRKVYHSITEVIPGYLARLLQVSTATMRGSRTIDGVDLPVFDWKREKFSSDKKVKEDMRSEVTEGSQTKTMDYHLSQVSKAFTGKDVGGNDEVQIKKQLHRMMMDQKADFTSKDVEKMISAASDTDLSRKNKTMMLKHLRTVRKKGQQGDSFINHLLSQGREGAQMQVNEIKTQLGARIREGYGPSLEEIGLATQNPNNTYGYDINLKGVMELVRNRGVSAKAAKPEAKKSDLDDLIRSVIGNRPPEYNPDDEELNEFGRTATSDRNAKTEIRGRSKGGILDRLKKLSTYGFRYRKGMGDGGKHQSYMAQDVKKQFGESAAPGGVKVDHAYMNSMNTEAIKELHEGQQNSLKDPTAIDLLTSIDRRLMDLNSLNKLAFGAILDKESLKKLFADTKVDAKHLAAFSTGKVKQGANFTGKKVGEGIGAATAAAGEAYEKRKGLIGEIFSALNSVVGTTVNTGIDFGRKGFGFLSGIKEDAKPVLNRVSDSASGILDKLHGKSGQSQEPGVNGVTVTGVDKAITNGNAQIQVFVNRNEIKYKNFILAVDQQTAEVAFIEKDVSTKGYGYALEAYIAIGDELASKGIKLMASSAQYAKGADIWKKLLAKGYAERVNGRYSFVATSKDPKKSRGLMRSLFGIGVHGATSVVGFGITQAANIGFSIIPNAIKSLHNTIKNAKERVKDFFSKPKDLYHHSDPKNPIIRADEMAKGEYMDDKGVAILDLDQLKEIKGNLYRKSDGNIQVTEQQFKDGLLDIHGQKLQFMVTRVRDVLLGGAGWVGGRMVKGFERLRGLFNSKPGQEDQGSFMGRMFSGIGNGLSGILGAGKGLAGKMGFGKSQSTLEDILKLLKKWDEKGMGTGTGSDGAPSTGGTTGGTSDIPGDLLDGSAGGTATTAAASGNGFGVIGSGFNSAKNFLKGKDVSGKLKSAGGALANTKLGSKITSVFGVGKSKFGNLATKAGGLFGGRIGKLGGFLSGAGKGLVGGVAGAAGSLLGGSGEEKKTDDSQQTPTQVPGQPQGDAKSSILAKLLKGMKTIPEKFRKWNDRDGSGRRDGSAEDRLEAMKDNHRLSDPAAQADPARYAGSGGIMNKMGDIFKFLSTGLGGLFSGAAGLLGVGPVGGKLKSLGQKALKLLGKHKRWGKLAGVVGAGAAGLGLLGDDEEDTEGDEEGDESAEDSGLVPAAAAAATTGGIAGGGRRTKAERRKAARARLARMRATRGPAGAAGATAGAGKRGLAKLVGMGALKGIFKQIPGLGTAAGFGMGAVRALKGDFVGAGLEVASTLPGFGLVATTALVALDASRALAPPVVPGAAGAAPAGPSLIRRAMAKIFTPARLGKLALGVGAYATYKTYKYLTRDQIDKYQQLRYLQYGLPPQLERYNHVLANLEEYLLDGRVGFEFGEKGTSRPAYLLEKKIEPAELLDIFDINPDDEKAVANFTEWFDKRFKSFFLTTVTALFGVNPKLKLNTMKKLEDAEVVKLIMAIKFEEGPYGERTSPFKEVPAMSNNKEIVTKKFDEMFAAASKEANAKEASRYDNVFYRGGSAVASAIGIPNEIQKKQDALDAKTAAYVKDRKAASSPDRPNYVEKSMANVGLPSSMSPDAEDPDTGRGGSGRPADPSGATTSTISSSEIPKLAAGSIMDGSNGLKFIKLASGNVKLQGLNPSVLKNLLGMAEEYGKLTNGKSILIKSAYRSRADQERLARAKPGLAAKPGGSAHEYGLALDITTADANALEKLGLMKKYGFTRPVGQEPWHTEPAGIQGRLNDAKQNPMLAAQMTDAGLYKGGGGYGTMSGARKLGRDQAVQLALLNAPSSPLTVQTKIDQSLTDASKSMTPTVASNDAGYTPIMGPSVGFQKPGAKRQVHPSFAAENQNKAFSLSTNGKYPLDGTSEGESRSSGSGGDASGVDMFATDRAGVLKAIDAFGSKTGVSTKDLQTFAAMESSLDPTAKAGGGQSAAGLYGFTNGTWSDSMKRHSGKYGLSGNETQHNIKASTVLAGELMKTNMKAISSVKPNPNLVDAYLAHFLGAGGARTFFRASPSAIGATVLPDAAAKNRDTFYDKSGRPRTIAEIYTYISEKLKKVQKDFGISGGNIPSTMKTPASTSAQSTSSSSSGTNSSAGFAGGGGSMPATDPVTTTESATASNRKSIVSTSPEEISAPAPLGMSNRADRRQQDEGESAMGDMVSISRKNMNINLESLDTMKEIRDMIKTMVEQSANNSKKAPAAPISRPQAAPSIVDIDPVLNVARRRNYKSA